MLAPKFEGALSFFTRAAELFSQTYDGKDEVRSRVVQGSSLCRPVDRFGRPWNPIDTVSHQSIAPLPKSIHQVIESDYFDAMELQALLRLYQGQCPELDALLDGAQRKIDLDAQERSAVALLRGYCEEREGSVKAGMYFSLAREYDPEGCHETLLDATYQPAAYGLSHALPPRGDGYWEHLMDLMAFRQLYAHRARLANEGSTWPGSLWAAEPQRDGDAHGANLGWGLNAAGVAKAGEILQGEVRCLALPCVLAVCEGCWLGLAWI